jgi:hypothetical protein
MRNPDAFHGLDLCRELAEYGSCKKIDRGCKYFHKGIDCIQQFKSHDCTGGCRYEHRKTIDDTKFTIKSEGDQRTVSLKRKSDHDSDSRHSRDHDRDSRDSHREGPREHREHREHRDHKEHREHRDSGREKEKERDGGQREGSHREREVREVPHKSNSPPTVVEFSPSKSKKMKIEDDRNAPSKMMKPETNIPRDDRFSHQQPKRPFERENNFPKQGLAGHDIFIPSARPRSEPFPRDRDGRVPREVRDPRDPRDLPRDPRDPRGEVRDSRGDIRDPRVDPRDIRDGRDPARGFYPGETESRPINNKKMQGYAPQDLFGDRDRPPPYTSNQQSMDQRERERALDRIPDRMPERMPERMPDRMPERMPDRMPPRVGDRFQDGIGNRPQEMNRPRERIPIQERLAASERERSRQQFDSYVPDNFQDQDRNRPPMMNEDFYGRPIRRDIDDRDPRGMPARAEFNRGGMNRPNELPESEAARNMRMHRGNVRNVPDFPRGREMPPIGLRDGMPPPRDGPRMMANDFDMGAGREAFASRFRERVEMKADAWQGRGNDLQQPRAYPPQNEMRGGNDLGVRPPFGDLDRNMPPRGAEGFQRGPDFGRPGLRDPVRPQFNNGPVASVHPFASRVDSFAQRNNAVFESNAVEDKRHLRGPLGPTKFARGNNNNFNNNNNNNRDGQNPRFDPRDRNQMRNNNNNYNNNHNNNQEWRDRTDLALDHSNHRAERERRFPPNSSDQNRDNSNADMKKEENVKIEGEDEKDKQLEGEPQQQPQEGEGQEEQDDRREETSENQRSKNVRHVLSKLNIFPSLAGPDLYDHITQIKRESCHVKEQANKKIIAERTLAAQIMKEATGGETDVEGEEYSSIKTDLSASTDFKGEKERVMNDDMDGDENMEYNDGRLLDDYFYNLRRIQEIPNISEIIFTQFCNPMKVGPN